MALKTFDGSISFHEVRFSTVCWVMNWHIPSNTSKKHMRNWGIDSPSAVSTSSHFNQKMFSAVSTSSHFNHQMFSAVSTSSYFNHQMFSAVSTSSHFNHHDNQLHPYPQGPQFPQKNFTNSAANLVNSAAHHGNTDEIPCITAATQVKFRGLIKSWLDKSNTWTTNLWILHYLLINYHFHQSTKPKINVNKLVTEQL